MNIATGKAPLYQFIEYFELPDTCSLTGETTSEAKWLQSLSLSKLSTIQKVKHCVERKRSRYMINSTKPDWRQIFRSESWWNSSTKQGRWDATRETQLRTLSEWLSSRPCKRNSVYTLVASELLFNACYKWTWAESFHSEKLWRLLQYPIEEPFLNCFKKRFTTLKAYINLFWGHVQCFGML
jgi:hypothetical protein